MTKQSTCGESVTRVYGRGVEFQTRSYAERCGQPVEEGHTYCARHEAQHVKDAARGQMLRDRRVTRAAAEVRHGLGGAS